MSLVLAQFQFYSLSAYKRLWKVFSTKRVRHCSFVECLKQRESLPREFLLNNFISLPLADRIDYQQGAQQKEPVTALFTERFKIDESMEL